MHLPKVSNMETKVSNMEIEPMTHPRESELPCDCVTTTNK